MSEDYLHNFICPWCRALTGHKELFRYATPQMRKFPNRDNAPTTHQLTRCVSCGGHTYRLMVGDLHSNLQDLDTAKHNNGASYIPPRPIHQYPLVRSSAHDSVPLAVNEAMSEAEDCLAVCAANAAGTMARRAMDAMCIDKGAKGKGPYERLEDLKNRGTITPELWEWASELRQAGKVGAHPEWEAMDQVEAEYAVKLLRELVHHVYIVPAEVVARRLAGKPKAPPAASTP